MLNPSDQSRLHHAEDAGIAQFLRGGQAFGSILYCEGLVASDQIDAFESGYADCFPVSGGTCWREPDSFEVAEVLR